MSEIPFSWCKAPLGQIAEKITKGTTPTTNGFSFQKDGINFIKVENLVDGRISLETVKDYISEPAHQAQSRSALKRGDVLFSIAGTIGEIATVEQIHLPANTNQALAIISGFDGAVTAKFLEFQLKSFASREITGRARGGAMNNISLGDLRELTVRVAPTKEQPRIVAKIEELFSELDEGVESLTTAREQLKVYRQAVLKHAFEGKLTADWRAGNPDKLETPEILLSRIRGERETQYLEELKDWQFATVARRAGGDVDRKPQRVRPLETVTQLAPDVVRILPAVPESWSWAKLAWLTGGVEYGTGAKSSKTGTVPVIRMGNLQNGRLDWSDLVFTDDVEEIAQYELNKGDVLFNRTNSPELVGKTAIFRGERQALFAGYLIRVNHNPRIVDGAYLNFFLNAHVARQYGSSVKTDGVNQSNINGEKLKGYPFPYCSLAEQKQIVQRLEERTSECDTLIEAVEEQILRADALRQSILKKAFFGQLVPQDPNEESALVLLDRIRSEKRNGNSSPKKSKKREKDMVS